MNSLFLGVRVFHIMMAATWFGTVVFVTLMLFPAVGKAGPAGGQVVLQLGRRRLDAFIASIAGLTVLSGLWLYWRYTDGFNPALSASMGGRVFGAGGVLGIIAAVIAGAVVGKNMKRAIKLLEQMEKTEADGKPALMAQIVQHRRKAALGGRIVLALLFVTITLMALGHYV